MVYVKCYKRNRKPRTQTSTGLCRGYEVVTYIARGPSGEANLGILFPRPLVNILELPKYPAASKRHQQPQ